MAKASSAKTATKKTAVKKVATPAKKRGGLGSPLDKLLGKDDLNYLKQEGQVSQLSLEQLQPGKYQPRYHMGKAELTELADSIRAEGVLSPLLVRPLENNRYEIIAGERRFKAAQLAGLKQVPVLIKNVDDQKAAVIALIENMQREDLSAIEEAKGLKRLIQEFDFTHEQAAQAVGRSRSFTSNLLRLLHLAQPVQDQLERHELEMGHARALLSLPTAEQIMVANSVISQQLSVRETEKRVQQRLQADKQASTSKTTKKTSKSRDITRLEESLSDYLGTRVEIKVNKKQQGQLIMDFNDWEQLNTLLEKQGLDKILES